jgi:hypothetical protein
MSPAVHRCARLAYISDMAATGRSRLPPLLPPELGPLRAVGIPVVPDEPYAGHAPDSERRRSLLAAFLRYDGWSSNVAA